MTMTDAVGPPRQIITLAMRALHRLDGVLPFRRYAMCNTGPILSITFDDVPESAAGPGASVIEAAGLRATFFVSTGLIGSTGADWRHAGVDAIAALAARGHEIGLHSHAHVPAARLGRRSFAQDLACSRAALRTLLPEAALDNYAYPFGFADPLHRAFLSRAMRSSRTTHPGINVGTVDPHRLLSYAVGEKLHDQSRIDRLLDEAVATRGWLVLTLHDIAPRPSPYGCTAEQLARTVDGALGRGMAVCTMGEALDRCALPSRGGR